MMCQYKLSIKYSAILRNLTIYCPILYNTTRWSGKLHVLKIFIKTQNELKVAQENPDSSFEMNGTAGFINGVKKNSKILERIEVVTKFLQK